MGIISALPLAGRHALVTGAGRGIGAAIARRLAADGARLTLVGRSLEPLCALAAELGGGRDAAGDAGGRAVVQVLACDVADAQAVAQAVVTATEAAGPVEILVNNAGQAESAPVARTGDDLWQRMLAVNLTATFLCCRAVWPGMQAARRGRIVNVASTAGQRGYAYVCAYTAAKHGVVGLTRSLALEGAALGITVNAVCPGYTETDLLRASVDNVATRTGRSAEAARAEFARHNPQGRLVQPQEVADAAAWLCGEGAAAVNGQCIGVSGGEVM